MSRKKLEKQEKSALQQELQTLDAQGVSLWLDGRPSTPKEIVKAYRVEESNGYMRDYVSNEKGGVREVRFDKIK